MKLIHQARLLDQETLCDVLFDENGIHKIAEHIEEEVDEVIEAKGQYLLSGLIDVHVHLREPGFSHKETIKTGTQAAAHGGFTTVMAMPNVLPYPDCAEVMKEYLQLIEKEAEVHVIPYACITKGEKSEELSDMEQLYKLGIHAFSDDGVGVKSAEMMEKAMQKAKALDAMIVAHTEDMKYRTPTACMHEGIRNKELGLVGIPSACEYSQIKRDLELAKQTGAKYHICHISAKESVELLRTYKKQGVDCSGEVTAHHLLLNEMDVQNPNHKMNPPLRSEEDRQALIAGLLDGTIDMIANDHAPHSEEEKKRGMEKAPFGIVALETAFPLLYTRFVKEEKCFSLDQLMYFMSEAPAKRFGMERKGKLAVGYDADMFLLNVEATDIIDPASFLSKGKNTPFDGWNCACRIEKTFVNGKIAYERKETL